MGIKKGPDAAPRGLVSRVKDMLTDSGLVKDILRRVAMAAMLVIPANGEMGCGGDGEKVNGEHESGITRDVVERDPSPLKISGARVGEKDLLLLCRREKPVDIYVEIFDKDENRVSNFFVPAEAGHEPITIPYQGCPDGLSSCLGGELRISVDGKPLDSFPLEGASEEEVPRIPEIPLDPS